MSVLIALFLASGTAAVGRGVAIDIADPTGDMRTAGQSGIADPAYLDLQGLRVEPATDGLDITITVAGPYPEDPRTAPAVEYGVFISLEDTEEREWYRVDPAMDWTVSGGAQPTAGAQPIKAQVFGTEIVFSVPMTPVESAGVVDVSGYMLAIDLPDPSAFALDGMDEYVPNDFQWPYLEDQISRDFEDQGQG